MVQFPAIICCLTCKCMLRQRGTAALSCAAVRFKGWKLQGMLFPGWAPASEGSSTDLIFQAAPLSVRAVLTALQNLRYSRRFVFHSTAPAPESSTNTQTWTLQVPLTPTRPRAPSQVEMTEHWQPKVESSSILQVAAPRLMQSSCKSGWAKQQQECSCLLLQGRSFSAAQQSWFFKENNLPAGPAAALMLGDSDDVLQVLLLSCVEHNQITTN